MRNTVRRTLNYVKWKCQNIRLTFPKTIAFFIGLILVGYWVIPFHSKNIEINLKRFARAEENREKVLTVDEILKFPESYHTKGTLSLPFGNIVEPFEAWYSGEHRMSRIDYYGGMDRTYQRQDLGKYGFSCKIVPEFSERTQKTFRGCLHRRGTKSFPVKAQSVVPTSHYFKYMKDIELRGKKAAKWRHTFTIYNKINTYILFTTKTEPVLPLRYEMMGYDTLLSSYYDHYILDYDLFEPWPYKYDIFQIPTDLDCFDFTTKKFAHIVGKLNPMLEYIPQTRNDAPFTLSHNTNELFTSKYFKHKRKMKHGYRFSSNNTHKFHSSMLKSNKKTHKRVLYSWPSLTEAKDRKFRTITGPKKQKKTTKLSIKTKLQRSYEDILNLLFKSFKMKHKKAYTTPHEHEIRKDIYRHNLRFILSRNRMNLGYKLRPNHLMDRTENEINEQKGLLSGNNDLSNGGLPFKPISHDIKSEIDWRKKGAVNLVSSQGICGSCYAYAVTGALEGAFFIKHGFLPNLSEQEIIDCSWGFGNRGCKGGYPYRALQWILKHNGLANDQGYGNYLAQEGYCHFKNVSVGVKLSSFMNISRGNVTELKQALTQYGPVSVLINTQPKSFKFYSSGVYYDPECGKSHDHAALAVGYGEEGGTPYWIVKNSWSKAWGDGGYIKIAQKNDNCGVASQAVVVDIK